MKVEFSKEQKESIGEKIALCLGFLKQNIQPHLATKDKIVVPVSEDLDLSISREEVCIIETKIYSLGIDLYKKNIWYLEKADRKKAKKYVCEACPELAVDFLKHWEKTKRELLIEVNKKNNELDRLTRVVDDFKL